MNNVFATFLQTSSLYEYKEISKDNITDLIDLLEGKVRISVYCKECKQERVFNMKPVEYYFISDPLGDEEIVCASLGEELNSFQQRTNLHKNVKEKNVTNEWSWRSWYVAQATRIIKFEYTCSMDPEHHLDFIVLTTDNSMIKIGQYPSVADLTFPELDAYKHVISKEDRRELGTAIGLFADGVGAGSYVYLRRVLERLVRQAKENAGDSIDEVTFAKAKMADQIKMLEGYVPDTLVKNTAIYGILSKGIHELSEKECLQYFPVVKQCIYQILGMWEDLWRRQKAEAALNRELNAITTSIK